MSTAVVTFAASFAALYAAHEVADHWIQTDHQAGNKGKPGHTGRMACAAHVATYTLTGIAALAALKFTLGVAFGPVSLTVGLAVSGITHYIADRRTPLRKLAAALGHKSMVTLGVPREGKDDNPSLGTGMYALDQAFHVGWLFIAAVIIGGGAA